MNIEQRLTDALRAADTTEPSGDLFARVVHSIEEDQEHRRRVIGSAVASLATIAALVIVGFLALEDGPHGLQIRLPVIELIEIVALVALIVVLGPAIRRFGRGYANDLWPATPATATALLRLLDIAYLLVFIGYILMSTELDFGTSGVLVAEQVQEAGYRIGGLVLVMGLLHAVTIMALPVVALVSNSTRVGRKLPRWLMVILVLAGLAIGGLSLMALAGLLEGAS
jgi:hypothetical protein